MKVRIGFGVAVSSPGALAPILDGIGAAGFDSLWLPEVLTGPSFDPMIALTWAAARYPKLKLGTTMLLPGRNIVRLAKQLASLDSLSDGRLLVTFVPGINRGAEADAIGVPLAQRRAAIEAGLPALRALLASEISPAPVQQPLEFWLGGTAPRSLELCGRVADGWLPSLCTVAEAVAGKAVIEESAATAGRSIDPEHFGVSIGYSVLGPDSAGYQQLAARAGDRDLDSIVPIGLDALRELLANFIEAGFSKFVVRPLDVPSSWPADMTALADAVLDLQT
jgi:probable F420-dependent oxidoreductase